MITFASASVHHKSPRLLVFFATGLLLLLLAAVPPTALAGCGGVKDAPSTITHTWRAPLAIGDSTMLLALHNMADTGWHANAHGCRQMVEGLQLMRRERHAGRLPHLVLLALGTDGTITMRQIQTAIRMVSKRGELVLLTPLELGGHGGADAQVMRRAAKRYPQRVRLLDWVKYSRHHRAWFQPDGAHLTAVGAQKFARYCNKVMKYARPPVKPTA